MARIAIYGENEFTIEDDALTVEQVKESMSQVFAELSNAQATVKGNEIHFEVKAGTKGMARIAIYGENEFTIEDDALTVEQVKESMSQVFAELSNAQATVKGNEIHFEVKAGTKGMARIAIYGENEFTIEDDALTVEQVKESMSQVFAELSNAQATVKGNEIHFEVKAGTKGARLAVYGENEFTIEDDALTPKEVQESMSQVFAELSNATYTVQGDRIVFEVKAGTKGLTLKVVVELF